jgi:hypothetical protein
LVQDAESSELKPAGEGSSPGKRNLANKKKNFQGSQRIEEQMNDLGLIRDGGGDCAVLEVRS